MCGAELNIEERNGRTVLEMRGTKDTLERAKLYVGFVMQQRVGPVQLPPDAEHRDDLTIIEVRTNFMPHFLFFYAKKLDELPAPRCLETGGKKLVFCCIVLIVLWPGASRVRWVRDGPQGRRSSQRRGGMEHPYVLHRLAFGKGWTDGAVGNLWWPVRCMRVCTQATLRNRLVAVSFRT